MGTPKRRTTLLRACGVTGANTRLPLITLSLKERRCFAHFKDETTKEREISRMTPRPLTGVQTRVSYAETGKKAKAQTQKVGKPSAGLWECLSEFSDCH